MGNEYLNNVPSYLYHYTSVDVLALILKNHTIRLHPLSSMDDPQEARNADLKRLGDYIFVSSWTEDSEESIPMWRLYTNPESGVRIKMKANPFERRRTLISEFANSTKTLLSNDQDPMTKIDTFLDLSVLVREKIMSPQAYGGKVLFKMEYSDDMTLLEPKTLNIDGSQVSIDFSKLGKVKSKYWQFQKEWRYLMQFMSFNMQGSVEDILASFTKSVNRLVMNRETPPFYYYDLKLNDTAFFDMEITKSPNISAGNEEIIELLVQKYNPSAQVIDSELRGNL